MDLIAAAYGDDSDDLEDSDPWSFSRVSTKRTLNEVDERPQKKLPVKLPPPCLPKIKSGDDEYLDNSADHGGRVRSFPHERGNWASFVHFPWKTNEDFMSLIQLINMELKKFNFEMEAFDDFHVSLTKTVVLRHHWIEGFVASVRKQLDDVKSFSMFLGNLETYVNEDRTRTFLAFSVSDTSNNLDLMVQRLDICMKEYQLPEFYQNPSHHVSIAWCLGDRKQELDSLLASGLIVAKLPSSIMDQISSCEATQVICKISQMTYVCNLKS